MFDDTSLSDCKVSASTFSTDVYRPASTPPQVVQVPPFVSPSLDSKSSKSHVSLDLSTQVRALTNKGRALEIRLKSSAREKKEMEQRYCSMLEHRDSELEEKAARIQHLHKMVKELKDKALWNPNHKDIYYRRR